MKKRAAIGHTIASASKSLTKVLQDSLAVQREERNSDKHGNKAFLMSYVPIMDNLSQQAQLQTRMRISQIFNDLAFSAQQSPCPSQGSSYTTTRPTTPFTLLSPAASGSQDSEQMNLSDYLTFGQPSYDNLN